MYQVIPGRLHGSGSNFAKFHCPKKLIPKLSALNSHPSAHRARISGFNGFWSSNAQNCPLLAQARPKMSTKFLNTRSWSEIFHEKLWFILKMDHQFLIMGQYKMVKIIIKYIKFLSLEKNFLLYGLSSYTYLVALICNIKLRTHLNIRSKCSAKKYLFGLFSLLQLVRTIRTSLFFCQIFAPNVQVNTRLGMLKWKRV